MSEEIKDVLDGLGKGFEEFKTENQKRLDEIEQKGHADPLLQEKVDKMSEEIASLAEVKQTAELQSKNLEDAQSKIEALETVMARPSNVKSEDVDIRVKAFGDWLRKGEVDEMEKKALYESDDTLGGFYAPTEYVEEIIKTVTEISPIRSIARIRQTNKRGIEIPKRTGQFSAQWVAETGTRSETTGYTTGLMQIDAHEQYALVDISQAMLEDSAFNLESEMASEFSEQFSKAEGTAFVSGSGVGQPLGFTDSTAGVGSTNSGSGSALTANGLLDLVYAIKSEYLGNSRFVMNRTTFAKLLQLEDGEGQKIFHVGLNLVNGAPSTIVGYPYVLATDMPAIGGSAKPIAFGDFSRAYTIVDRVNLSVMRDPYSQATSGNIRYVARRRVGGTVVLPEAIRLQNISA
jgi:HK97 family phage major capsid protein|tara:strand:+ start:224 stop:1435 length:1212 start_codon:yes stop_codon:yes gene_type:complete